METVNIRIESEFEVKDYLARLKYALNNGATITFQEKRLIDNNRNVKYTNKYTVAKLFPNEKPVDALKRELLTLTEENYICTEKDTRFPNKSEMRVFGKAYNSEDIFIRIRVELIDPNNCNNSSTFVMSFHFAERKFKEKDFIYKKS